MSRPWPWFIVLPFHLHLCTCIYNSSQSAVLSVLVVCMIPLFFESVVISMVLYRNRLLAIGSQFIAILNTTIVKTFYGYSALNPISSFPYHTGPHNDMLSYIYRMSLGVCFHSASVFAKYMLASNHVGSGAVSIIALMHCILSCIRLKWDARGYYETYTVTREYLVLGTLGDVIVAYNLIEPWYSADVCVFDRSIRPKSLRWVMNSTNTPFSICTTRGQH